MYQRSAVVNLFSPGGVEFPWNFTDMLFSLFDDKNHPSRNMNNSFVNQRPLNYKLVAAKTVYQKFVTNICRSYTTPRNNDIDCINDVQNNIWITVCCFEQNKCRVFMHTRRSHFQ